MRSHAHVFLPRKCRACRKNRSKFFASLFLHDIFPHHLLIYLAFKGFPIFAFATSFSDESQSCPYTPHCVCSYIYMIQRTIINDIRHTSKKEGRPESLPSCSLFSCEAYELRIFFALSSCTSVMKDIPVSFSTSLFAAKRSSLAMSLRLNFRAPAISC